MFEFRLSFASWQRSGIVYKSSWGLRQNSIKERAAPCSSASSACSRTETLLRFVFLINPTCINDHTGFVRVGQRQSALLKSSIAWGLSQTLCCLISLCERAERLTLHYYTWVVLLTPYPWLTFALISGWACGNNGRVWELQGSSSQRAQTAEEQNQPSNWGRRWQNGEVCTDYMHRDNTDLCHVSG